MRRNPQIVTNFQTRGINKRNAGALPKDRKITASRISIATAQTGDNCTDWETPIGNDAQFLPDKRLSDFYNRMSDKARESSLLPIGLNSPRVAAFISHPAKLVTDKVSQRPLENRQFHRKAVKSP